MQDMRALKNSRNLKSWRTWQGEAYRRSGFTAILLAQSMLTVGFVLTLTLYGRVFRHVAVAALMAGSGLYLATALGVMAFGVLRLRAWTRANPWTPPPQRAAWGAGATAIS